MGNSSFWITVTEFISLPPFLFVLAEILHGWYVIVIILVAAAQMTEHPKLSVTNLNGSIVLPLMISGTTLAFVESIRVLTPFTEWSQHSSCRPLARPLAGNRVPTVCIFFPAQAASNTKTPRTASKTSLNRSVMDGSQGCLFAPISTARPPSPLLLALGLTSDLTATQCLLFGQIVSLVPACHQCEMSTPPHMSGFLAIRLDPDRQRNAFRPTSNWGQATSLLRRIHAPTSTIVGIIDVLEHGSALLFKQRGCICLGQALV